MSICIKGGKSPKCQSPQCHSLQCEAALCEAAQSDLDECITTHTHTHLRVTSPQGRSRPQVSVCVCARGVCRPVEVRSVHSQTPPYTDIRVASLTDTNQRLSSLIDNQDMCMTHMWTQNDKLRGMLRLMKHVSVASRDRHTELMVGERLRRAEVRNRLVGAGMDPDDAADTHTHTHTPTHTQ
eukprot:GHVR01109755.1.p1 GENE.GHVR01109755.1~~GHVR01109755.1.p1  ORF type:complete len:213 (+),score=127.46 GHVR01109755.1:96-641(+)